MTRTARPVTYRTTAVRTPDSVTLSVRRSPRELLRAVVARLLRAGTLPRRSGQVLHLPLDGQLKEARND